MAVSLSPAITVNSVTRNVPSDDNEVELRMRELVLLGSGDNTACPLADLARASQSQPPQSQLPQTTMTKSRPKTGPDRPQAYVYAPQRAAAASC
jgi:hypothetical protein